MKIWFKALCCALTICCLMSMTGFYGACEDISQEVFRLHIIAHSDSDEDQALKLRVRDEIVRYTASLFNGCNSKEEAIAAAKEKRSEITALAREVVRNSGYDYPVEVYVTKMSFNTRIYDRFTLPAGEYDALRVVIGSGRGKNWWCVLYPALCFSASGGEEFQKAMNSGEEEIVTESGQYEVKFRIVEFFESLFSFFR